MALLTHEWARLTALAIGFALKQGKSPRGNACCPWHWRRRRTGGWRGLARRAGRQPTASASDTGVVNRQGAQDAKLPEPDKEVDHVARVVVDAALEVHRILGPGFLESVYEQALSVELGLRAVRFARRVPGAVTYKSVAIGEARLDLLVADRLVVELKACPSLLPIHLAQVLSYLKASDRSLALLINFNVPLLRQAIRRVIRTP